MKKSEQLIIEIIKERVHCNITEIVKICYLNDLSFFKSHGKQISDFNYIRYFYGPYDAKITASVNNLIKDGYINSFSQQTGYGDLAWLHSINFQNIEGLTIDLSKEEKEHINRMLIDLKNYNASELTAMCYETKPMKKLEATLGGNENLGTKLDFNTVK